MAFRFDTRSRSCLLAALVAGCGGESTQPPGPPAGVLPMGATSLAMVVGSTAVDSVSVKVVDADGRAVSNAQVYWTAGPEVLVTVSPEVGVTDREGMARVGVRVGTIAGATSVRAAILGGGPSASFQVAVSPGPMTQLLVPDTALLVPDSPRPLVLGGDLYGNPTPLTGVTLTSSSPAVAEVSALGVVTPRALGSAVITAAGAGLNAQSQVWVVPATIRVCETYSWIVCGEWKLGYSAYNATWSQGSTATVRVGHFSADSVRFHREDTPGTPSAGMSAVYTGHVEDGRVKSGTVTWTQHGSRFSGYWSADW